MTHDTYPYVMELVLSAVLGFIYLLLLAALAVASFLLVPFVLIEFGVRRLCLIIKDAPMR